MAKPVLSDMRLFLIRSFYPGKYMSELRDPRLGPTLDCLADCGVDTSSYNVSELRTDKRLGREYAQELKILQHFEGKTCLFIVWSQQCDEPSVTSFFEELDAAYHSPVADSLKLWFNQSEQRSVLHYTSKADGIRRRVYSVPYLARYGTEDVQLLSAFLRHTRPSSVTMTDVRPSEPISLGTAAQASVGNSGIQSIDPDITRRVDISGDARERLRQLTADPVRPCDLEESDDTEGTDDRPTVSPPAPKK